MIICAREGCNETFTRKTHNMKYHDDECCRLATNQRIMEKYYEGRDRKLGKTRYCKSCDKTKLSRYNETQVCAACKTKNEVQANQSVADMLMSASILPA